QGCPAVKAETVRKVNGTAKKIYFITGKTNLLKQSFPRLNELAAILKADPSLRLTIDGYSDNIGTDERNAMFSSGRANAVKDYLVKKGISADRLTAVGHGAADPIADNNTFLGRCKNRRVEMHLQRW
ncbi:MAG TPA: OmpA family protein, partial [Chitinophagaceae bacterium]|nr:OmpA family protein [Chitinophagaceae bacterium]